MDAHSSSAKMGNFNELGLKKELVVHLASLGYTEPLEVQKEVIPLAIQGKNIVFTSRTGSGKTLAYLLGYLNKINKKQALQMMVIVPTRELGIQVGKEMKKICEALNLNVGVLYGGRDIAGDYKTLVKKLHVLVGTPGRIIQHINEKHIKVGEVKYIVYDESDQLFDQGFYDGCVYLKERISKEAQILLSSATITNKVQKFLAKEIQKYELLRIGTTIPTQLVQEKIYVEIKAKNTLLIEFFNKKRRKKNMVFCNTKMKVHDIADHLKNKGFNARPITSSLTQEERTNTLNLFKEGKINILVATDVAARGLHIEQVDVIVNYDIPNREEFYVHRIGRTGRVDKKGYAINFICKEDLERFETIEQRYKLDVTELDTDLMPI